MEYKPVHKKNSSWTPTPVQKKGKSSGKIGHSSIQPKSNPSSAPSQEIGEYKRASADRLAANVMRGIQAKEQEQDRLESNNPKQIWQRAQSIKPVVQRRIDPRVQMRQMVQRAHQIDGNQASGDLESRLNASKGEGSPLSEDVRGFMEPRFGADLSGVRVHTGGEAVQMNRELGAQAFTHGSDVYFGALKSPKSPGNNELTAHELTHVMQQNGSQLQTKSTADESGDTYEQKALETRNSLELDTQLNDSSYQIAIAPAIAIPLGVGVLLVAVGAVGIIINWKSITGTVTEIGTIAVDWASDTARDVTDRIIDAVSQTGLVARNILEGAKGAIEEVIRSVLRSESEEIDPYDPERDGSQDKKLSNGEIEALEEAGEDIHEIKKGCPGGVSKCDLYKDRRGNIYVKPKGSRGAGVFTGLNINNFW